MIEGVIALMIAVLILVVFGGPAWAIKIGQFGGLGFAMYVLILVIEWAIAKLKVK